MLHSIMFKAMVPKHLLRVNSTATTAPQKSSFAASSTANVAPKLVMTPAAATPTNIGTILQNQLFLPVINAGPTLLVTGIRLAGASVAVQSAIPKSLQQKR